ncbi:MAG: GxxExxY protein [Ignavibacteriales bacterium CG_4_9_14_3_um_filter_30_11]|nr:MAG: GxxExxY protein [Ignavibacteriales bacterium CG_4_9_14_3_um_filter_30_11]
MNENEISKIIVNKCFQIHNSLGPGLLESVYEETLFYELTNEKFNCQRQKGIPVVYNDIKMELGFRADIIVEDKVIVEIKSVEALAPVHFKQLLTYLKLTGLKLGLLVNFNEALIKNGLKRIVNNL